MRPFTRQSSRLASTSRVRQQTVSQHQIERKRRGFTGSAIRSDDIRTPNGPPGRHTPVSESRQPQRNSESAGEHEEPAEQESGEAKSGVEQRRSGGRRTLRQRRLETIPNPPPIPDWFLRHNVKLVEERTKIEDIEVELQTVHCIDTETGHTLFSVPHHEPHKPRGRSTVCKKDAHTVGSEREPQKLPQDSFGPESKPLEESKHAALENELGQNFFEQKYNATRKPVKDQLQSQESLAAAFEPPTNDEIGILGREWQMDPMRCLFLEAETSIRAAFSFADDTQPLSRFATDQVDVSLQCPDPNSHEQMDVFVQDLATIVNADVIQVDANDFAELTDEYVGQGDDKPGSFSNLAYDVFRGYVAASLDKKPSTSTSREDEYEEDEFDEDDDADEDGPRRSSGFPFGRIADRTEVMKLLHGVSFGKFLGGRVLGAKIGIPGSAGSMAMLRPQKPTATGSNANRDERLNALFDTLLSAVATKRLSLEKFKTAGEIKRMKIGEEEDPAFWQKVQRAMRAHAVTWLPDTARLLLMHLGSVLKGNDPTRFPYRLVSDAPSFARSAGRGEPIQQQTIVHVRDMDDIYDTKLGQHILDALFKAVKKRRRSGERIMIVGTTATDVPGPQMTGDELEDDLPQRMIQVSPFFNFTVADDAEFGRLSPHLDERNLDDPAYDRILEINTRHIQSMLRRMRPNDDVNVSGSAARKQLNLPGTHFLTEKVLPLDQVQRLALLAVGLAQFHAKADKVQPVHVALAAFISQRSDHVNRSWSLTKEKRQKKQSASDGRSNGEADNKSNSESGQARIDRVKKLCNPHESKLLHGVVDSQKIKTGYTDVHAPTETIEALKTLTSLALLRPDAFKYGVLANDRLPGLLLYGPPGTGKTLLAKAVAKESKATVLEASGAEIYDKYVGEGEKMVRAVFSLAKKLSPCVVFIDEADAIFGSRGNESNRTTHREIVNQFLREWDGMDDHRVFMMVATNRPFDLDDAVLRRLPRRLLVDLPVAKDRESILQIHLRDEALDTSVSLSSLAERTPFYSGSDLKNLSVAAALACVREENELAESNKDNQDFKLPQRRTLTAQHFDKALTEISASISEDMASLTRIRKFDEQYGDRKGRRKKTGYGFGMADAVVDENAVMVRQAGVSQPPPAP